MSRVIYEFTAGAGEISGAVIVAPDTWQLVGTGPLMVEDRALPEIAKPIYVNSSENLVTASTVQGQIYESSARSVYVRASEGHAVLVDNGA